MTKKYQAPIVKKAFQILKAISESETGFRISDMAVPGWSFDVKTIVKIKKKPRKDKTNNRT